MILLLLIIIPFYACLLVVYTYVFVLKRNEYSYNDFSNCVPISIIVPIRNEENNIIPLLNSFAKLNYPKHCIEIIIVNDHSIDNSVALIEEYTQKIDISIKLLSLGNNENGKKMALLKGIQNASFDLIATTDADCQHQPYWLWSMASLYLKYEPDLIIGPVFFKEKKGLFDHLLSIEQISLMAATAAAALLKNPIMCSGANLIFNKQSYLSAFQQLMFNHPSGDDMFLLQSFKKNKKKIIFNTSIHAIVFTQPPGSWSDFIQQRRRWVSKSKYYNDLSIVFIAILVALVNFSIVILLLLSLCKVLPINIFFTILIIKTIVDYPFLKVTAWHYNQKLSISYFLIAQLCYPWYVVFFTIYGNFGYFKWKTRSCHA